MIGGKATILDFESKLNTGYSFDMCHIYGQWVGNRQVANVGRTASFQRRDTIYSTKYLLRIRVVRTQLY